MARKRKNIQRTVGRPPKSGQADVNTRAAILAAARRVFARRGVDGTSVREVSETAKVNNAMIYYHFRDKYDLYRAVLADSFSTLDRIWEHEIFKSAAPARRKIQKFIDELIRFQQTNEELRRIMSMEFATCGENCKWIANNYFQHHYKKLVAIMKKGIRSGELKRSDPAFTISSLIGMIVHSFTTRPVAEYVVGKRIDLSVSRFGKFIGGLFFDGLGLTQQVKSNVRSKR